MPPAKRQSLPFSAIKPNVLFSLGDGSRIMRGLSYLRGNRVRSLRWKARAGELHGTVQGGQKHNVVIRPKEDFLEHRCTCPEWAPHRACEHVIAVTAAWFWVTRDASYGPDSPQEKARLRAMVKAHCVPSPGAPPESQPTPPPPMGKSTKRGESAPPSPENRRAGFAPGRERTETERSYILITAGFEKPPVFHAVVRHHGVLREFGADIAARRFAARLRDASDPFALLRKHLKGKRSPGILVRRARDPSVIIDVRDHAEGSIAVELEHADSHVHARFIIQPTAEKGKSTPTPAKSYEVISPRLALGDDGTLLEIEITPPQFHVGLVPFLEPYETNGAETPDVPPLFCDYRLETARFNRWMPHIVQDRHDKCGLGGIRFFSNGREVEPDTAEGGLILDFEKSPYIDRKYLSRTKAKLETGNPHITFCQQLLEEIFEEPLYVPLFNEPDCSRQLLTALRRTLAAPDRKKPEDALRGLGETERFPSAVLREMARDFAMEVLDACHGRTFRWIQAREANPSPWAVFEIDAAKAMALHIAAHVPFPNACFPLVLRGSRNHELSEKELFDRLPALFEAAREIGAEVAVESLIARDGEVRIGVDVNRRNSGQDWFEINPEVRLADEDITEFALNGGFGRVIRKEDGFVILNDEQTNHVDALRALTTRCGKKNREALRIPPLAIFEWLFLSQRGVDLRLPPEDRPVLESLAAFRGIPPSPLPERLVAEPRDYQTDGYHWLAFLYRHRFGACLADDMGLGKTLQAILLLAAIKEGRLPAHPNGAGKPHLIVVPASLVFNWTAEIQRFAPSLNVYECVGPQRSHDYGDADVVVTTYGLLSRDLAAIESKSYHLLVLDEAQAVKNPKAARSRAVAKVKAAFRVCLTGTPVENHIGELQTILHLTLPGLFDGIPASQRKGDAFTAQILQRSRPFILRRTKEAVLTQLPPKTESVITLELSPAQRAFYTREAKAVRGEIKEAYAGMPAANAGVVALAALMRLRQICVAPGLLAPEHGADSPKFNYLRDALGELQEEGHSALVFSQFVKGLDLMEVALRQAGLDIFRLDGRTPVKERKHRVKAFQKSESPSVFLISLKAGGVGLNLTRATYVFHVDPWWNPAVENQASDRAHRIGQTNKVFIQRLIMRHTVEEKIQELKARKAVLYRRLFGGDPSTAGAKLTREDFDFLLGADP